MRTYLILKERAKRWNADAEIQSLLADGKPAAECRRSALTASRREGAASTFV